MQDKLEQEEQKTNDQKKYDAKIIKTVAMKVRQKLEGEGSGHDWWHIYRVWSNAKKIARNEIANLFIVELAALLHDIADWKFYKGDETVGPRVASEILSNLSVESEVIDHVCNIIKNISFKSADIIVPMKTIEGMIVQDADRIDAIGAIGIARCFSYGGYKNMPLYDPDIKVRKHQTSLEYKTKSFTGIGTSSVNHFYEKLLLLKERMNTNTGSKIANDRHEVMVLFLKQFLQEWDGNL